MPLYEYYCEECGTDFENMMRFDQSEVRPPCPKCGSQQTRKRISLFASKTGVGSQGGGSSCGSSSGGFT